MFWTASRLNLVAGAAFALAYGPTLARLVRDWATDDNYSHGFFIVPLGLYFGWQKREQLNSAPVRPSWWGLGLVAASLAALVAGTLGAELFVARASILGLAAGVTLFVWGPAFLRILSFPLGLLVLMVPVPALVFNQVAFPLQLVASRFGEAALRLLAVPVLREGNLIVLSNTTLEVAEACSGIRSIVSLLTLGIVLGALTDTRVWMRTALAVATVPVAIVVNGVRVAGTGIAAYYLGAEAATGFTHAFSGWLVFGLGFGLLFVLQRGLSALSPGPVPACGATDGV